MDTHISKNQIIRLIRKDLINVKMTTYLSEIPIPSDDYNLGLDELVFELMGIERLTDRCIDQIFRNYMARSAKVNALNISINQQEIDRLAEELYDYLTYEAELTHKQLDSENNDRATN